jgi:hypothetical protein
VLRADMVPAVLAKGGPTHRDKAGAPRFNAGDEVRTIVISPSGHTRLPRYARGKTGTVDKARSLSGYVTTADGELVLFSLLCNNFTVPTREVEKVQDFIVATLAGRSLGVRPVNAPGR